MGRRVAHALMYWSTLHCTALHCTALHCTALHCTALHCTALHNTVYITLHYTALQNRELLFTRTTNLIPAILPAHPCTVTTEIETVPLQCNNLYSNCNTAVRHSRVQMFKCKCSTTPYNLIVSLQCNTLGSICNTEVQHHAVKLYPCSETSYS